MNTAFPFTTHIHRLPGRPAFNTTGINNTGLGTSALSRNTTGNHNTALGRSALFFNTTGENNAAIGIYAGTSVTTASNANLRRKWSTIHKAKANDKDS